MDRDTAEWDLLWLLRSDSEAAHDLARRLVGLAKGPPAARWLLWFDIQQCIAALGRLLRPAA